MQDRDCSQIISFWGDELQGISFDHLIDFKLDAASRSYLEQIGLPKQLNKLDGALDIVFYFDKKVRLAKLNETNYLVLGNDSGTELCISLSDYHFYSIDFTNSPDIPPVCFVNTTVIKFIEAIQLFIEFKQRNNENPDSENKLIAEMKNQMKQLDPKSLDDGTWWSIVIDQPY